MPVLNRLLQQRLAHISASTSAPSAVLDEDVGVGSQSTSSFGRDVEIREVNLPAICWNKHRTDNNSIPLILESLLHVEEERMLISAQVT